MQLNLNLLKIISLLTLTIGLLAPAKIAEAGGSASESTEKIETLKGQDSAAEPYGAGELYAAAEKHGAEHGGKSSVIPKVFLSKKAIRIEFITFLSLIGLSIIFPEFLYKPGKKRQSTESSENNQNKPEQSKDIDLNTLASNLNYDDLKKLSLINNNSYENDELDDQNESDHKAA